jgi:hypothetical protein
MRGASIDANQLNQLGAGHPHWGEKFGKQPALRRRDMRANALHHLGFAVVLLRRLEAAAAAGPLAAAAGPLAAAAGPPFVRDCAAARDRASRLPAVEHWAGAQPETQDVRRAGRDR